MFNFKKKKKIAVHSGRFHADDVFAVGILGLVYGWNNLKVIRTRDQKEIDSADIVADVGSIYDPEKMRFDHHQKGGAGERENGIPYASCGLVWKKFGEELCGDAEIYSNIDKKLFLPIDAGDNGVELFTSNTEGVGSFSISEEIDILVSIENNDEENYQNFILEAKRATRILSNVIKKQTKKKNDRKHAKELYDSLTEKNVIVLDSWMSADIFVDLPDVFFVVYPSKDSWHARAVPSSENSFDTKKDFPEDWCGLVDEELEKITGVIGSKFCHKAGFLCVAKTKEGAVELAKKALSA